VADSIPSRGDITPRTYKIADVKILTGIPQTTIYEHARRDPARWGLIRVGRAIRFRRSAIDALVEGGAR
jgi:hypothetical protein